MHVIVISKNIVSVVLFIWTEYIFQTRVRALILTVQLVLSSDIDNCFDDICNALRVSSLES